MLSWICRALSCHKSGHFRYFPLPVHQLGFLFRKKEQTALQRRLRIQAETERKEAYGKAVMAPLGHRRNDLSDTMYYFRLFSYLIGNKNVSAFLSLF